MFILKNQLSKKSCNLFGSIFRYCGFKFTNIMIPVGGIGPQRMGVRVLHRNTSMYRKFLKNLLLKILRQKSCNFIDWKAEKRHNKSGKEHYNTFLQLMLTPFQKAQWDLSKRHHCANNGIITRIKASFILFKWHNRANRCFITPLQKALWRKKGMIKPF